MKVNNISLIATNSYNTPSFNGQILTKGKNWTPKLRDAFVNANAIKDLAKGEEDVIGKLQTYKAKKYDLNHFCGETLYKLSIELRKPKTSLLQKIEGLCGLYSCCINRHKHSEQGLKNIIENLDVQSLRKFLEKNIPNM